MDPISQKPLKSRRLKWLIISVLAVIAIAIVVSLFILDAAAHRVPAKIQSRIDALKKAGFPVTAEDLDKLYPPLPDNLNSALIYLKATNFTGYPPGYTNWPVYGAELRSFLTNPLPPEMKQSIANYVARNENILELLHKAAAVEKGFYDVGIKNGFLLSAHPPFVQIRMQAQFLALTAILRAEENQSSASAQAILDAFGLPRALGNSPLLTSQMIRQAILGLDVDTLEVALSKAVFSEMDLLALAASFRQPDVMDGIKQSLVAERCQAIWVYEQFIMNPDPEKSSFLDRIKDLYERIRYLRKNDFVIYLDLIENYLAAADLPFPECLEISQRLKSQLDASGASKRAVLSVLYSEWDKTFVNAAKCVAKLRLAQTALAVERFRLANTNQIPDSLAALVPAYLPAVPIYPFDGQPLRIKRRPQGYVICPSTTKSSHELTFTVGR